jgi:hypothetical protein
VTTIPSSQYGCTILPHISWLSFGSVASFETVVIPGEFYHFICYCNIFSSNFTIKFARFVYIFAVTLWSSLIERLSFSVLSWSLPIFLLDIYGISLFAKCFKIKQSICYAMSFLKPYFLLLLHIQYVYNQRGQSILQSFQFIFEQNHHHFRY